MFDRRLVLFVVLVLVVVGLALGAARPSRGAGDGAAEARYVVRPGDTLWEIADERYDGDPREAVWRIQQRNGLTDATLAPGDVLVLPAGEPP